jgi:hypothetical protein
MLARFADLRRNLRQQLLRFRQAYAREPSAPWPCRGASQPGRQNSATLLQTHDFGLPGVGSAQSQHNVG